MDLLNWISRHIKWSKKTFGEEERSTGIIKHIKKEIAELEEKIDLLNNPSQNSNPKTSPGIMFIVASQEHRKNKKEALMECVDIIILTIDLAWRLGFNASDIEEALARKQYININERKWPNKEDISPDQPSEHIKER